jgi:CheY-like chemotaxis protein
VLRDIPIIVLATASDVEDLEDCYAAGAQGHIVKPVNFDGFIQALQRLSGCWFELVRRPVMA